MHVISEYWLMSLNTPCTVDMIDESKVLAFTYRSLTDEFCIYAMSEVRNQPMKVVSRRFVAVATGTLFDAHNTVYVGTSVLNEKYALHLFELT
jgi:hypothetical protein